MAKTLMQSAALLAAFCKQSFTSEPKKPIESMFNLLVTEIKGQFSCREDRSRHMETLHLDLEG